jgi:hypothetical protein
MKICPAMRRPGSEREATMSRPSWTKGYAFCGYRLVRSKTGDERKG